MLLWILGMPTSQIQENTLISHCYRICKLNKTFCKYLKSAATSWERVWPKIKHFKRSKALSYSYKKLFFSLDFSPLTRNSVQGPSMAHCHSSPFSYHTACHSQIRTATFSPSPQQENTKQLG